MKKDILEVLACPVCKGELILENSIVQGSEVVNGVLKCVKCGRKYKIENGIPILLP